MLTDAPSAREFADLEPFAATWCLPTEPERFAQRLASTMDEMQAFYDAAPAGETRSSTATVPARRHTRDAERSSNSLLVGPGVVPGGGVAPAAHPDSGAAYLDLLIEPAI